MAIYTRKTEWASTTKKNHTAEFEFAGSLLYIFLIRPARNERIIIDTTHSIEDILTHCKNAATEVTLHFGLSCTEESTVFKAIKKMIQDYIN